MPATEIPLPGDGPLPADPHPELVDETLAALLEDVPGAFGPGPRSRLPDAGWLDLEVVDLVGEEDLALAAELADLDTTDSMEPATRLTVPTQEWSDAQLTRAVGAAERAVRAQTAIGLRATAALARRRPEPSDNPDESGLSVYALDELSVAGGLARGAMVYRLTEAQALVDRLPRTLDALQAGLIPLAGVRKMVDVTSPLTPAQSSRVETRVLDRLGARAGGPALAALGSMSLAEMLSLPEETVLSVSLAATTAMVGRTARDLVRRIDPAASRRRERQARTQRRVAHQVDQDGMGWLGWYAPEAITTAAFERITDLAKQLPTDPEAPRDLDARRADVLTDLILGVPEQRPGEAQPPVEPERLGGSWAAAPVNLEVLIDHTRCAGGGSGCVGESGRLGQVTARSLMQLLGLVEAFGGTVTGGHAVWEECPGPAVHERLGQGAYEPPDALKRQVRAHWRRCCFPGCARPARLCHIDHTRPYSRVGPTCICNTQPLCLHHHLLKHHEPVGHPGWRLVNHGGGHLTWTTPTGGHIEVWPDPPDPAPPPPQDPPPF